MLSSSSSPSSRSNSSSSHHSNNPIHQSSPSTFLSSSLMRYILAIVFLLSLSFSIHQLIEIYSSSASSPSSSSPLPRVAVDAAHNNRVDTQIESSIISPAHHFFLKHTYDRDEQIERNKAMTDTSANGNIDDNVASSLSSSIPLNLVRGSRILVLGSGGLIGRAMMRWLRASDRGYEVLEVKGRDHLDLRVADHLDVFDKYDVQFVIFLACEVGGSKFIQNQRGTAQQQIIEYNVSIYQSVLSWLSSRRIPFIFTSTSLVMEPDAYGAMKRLGESWIKSLPHFPAGKVARLWNVYGTEPITLKSHVLGDWISSCVRTGRVQSLTDGDELRMFLHTDDIANAIGTLMEHYDQADFITDVSSGEWVRMKDVGAMVVEHFDSPHIYDHLPSSLSSPTPAPSVRPCAFEFASTRATPRANIDPMQLGRFHTHWWEQHIDMADGINMLANYYVDELRKENEAEARKSTTTTTAAVAVEATDDSTSSHDEL